MTVQKGLAKISVENGKLVFEALTNESVANGIYLSGETPGGYRLGVTVCNTSKNLMITKEAEPLLESLFKRMKRGGDPVGDINWYPYEDQMVLSWFGENRKVFDLNDLAQLEQARGASFREGSYVIIE